MAREEETEHAEGAAAGDLVEEVDTPRGATDEDVAAHEGHLVHFCAEVLAAQNEVRPARDEQLRDVDVARAHREVQRRPGGSRPVGMVPVLALTDVHGDEVRVCVMVEEISHHREVSLSDGHMQRRSHRRPLIPRQPELRLPIHISTK